LAYPVHVNKAFGRLARYLLHRAVLIHVMHSHAFCRNSKSSIDLLITCEPAHRSYLPFLNDTVP